MTRMLSIAMIGTLILAIAWFSWFVITVKEPDRDARLERQLATIRSAQTIDDLRPLLEEIVRKQRNDYR